MEHEKLDEVSSIESTLLYQNSEQLLLENMLFKLGGSIRDDKLHFLGSLDFIRLKHSEVRLKLEAIVHEVSARLATVVASIS